MKKKFFILCAALVWTVALMAQSIAVVKANGSTTLVRTLDEAIAVVNENDGCVVYLPGGGFPVSDDSKITKKVTIIGIGHKSKNDNVDGVTIISGNIYFNEGSDGSALMGCYITGNVNIGEDAAVDDVYVKYCNLNSVQVKNADCTGTFINQNFIRGESRFGNSVVTITNNVLYNRLFNINGGIISYNILAHLGNWGGGQTMYDVNNVSITNNILRNSGGGTHYGSSIQSGNNLVVSESSIGSWGDIPVVIDAYVNDILVDVNNWSISPNSNFHFKENYKEYESQVGIYAGDGFNDAQIAPVPYIVAKRIDEQTDASGKLNVKIRVNAGGEEE